MLFNDVVPVRMQLGGKSLSRWLDDVKSRYLLRALLKRQQKRTRLAAEVNIMGVRAIGRNYRGTEFFSS